MEVITGASLELKFRTNSIGFITFPYFLICVLLVWFAWPKATNWKSIHKLKIKGGKYWKHSIDKCKGHIGRVMSSWNYKQ